MGEPGNALHRAASAGDVNQIRRLLLLPGADVDAPDDGGRTPLHLAAAEGHDEAVLLLLQGGARCDALDDDKASPLDDAAGRGCASTVRLFLDHVRPPSVNRCWSAAGWAARRQREDVFSILLDALQRRAALQDHLLDSCPDEARKAVWWVARRGDTRIASELLDRCPAALRLETETDGSTMLIVAAMFNQTNMVSFLLDRGADPWREDRRHLNAPVTAALSGSLEVVAALWERTEGAERLELWNARGSEHPPLCKAAQQGHLGAVQLLVELGLDKDTRDAGGHTPLCLAARGGKECSEVVTWLLSRGTDWREAVRCARSRGDEQIFSTLLRELKKQPAHQGNIDFFLEVSQPSGRSPVLRQRDRGALLRDAAQCGEVDKVRMLLAHGSDPLQRDGQSWTALHRAVQGGHVAMIDTLWEHTARSPREELRARALWAGRGEREPPLCLAAGAGQLAVAERLLELGADVNVGREHATHEAALYCAALSGHAELVRLLLEWGARLLLGPEGADTPLHAAVESGHLAVVQLLLPDPARLGEDGRREQLALLQHAGEEGRTALHRAVGSKYSSLHVVELLFRRELQLLEGHNNGAVRAGESPGWRSFTVYRRDARGRAPLQDCGERGVMRALLRHMEDDRVMALGGTDVQAVRGMVWQARAELVRDEAKAHLEQELDAYLTRLQAP